MKKVKINQKKCLKSLSAVLGCYLLLAVIFYWASGTQLFFRQDVTKSINPKEQAAMMSDGTEVSFMMEQRSDYLDKISLLVGTGGRVNEGRLEISVYDESGALVASTSVDTTGMIDYTYNDFVLDPPASGVKGQTLKVVIKAAEVPENQGIGIWYGDSIEAGKFTINDMNGNTYLVNGEERSGKICYTAAGRDMMWLGQWYWVIAAVLGAAIGVYVVHVFSCRARGKETLYSRASDTVTRYSFLMQQLVSRDFSKKYKRSILGVFWSFLNPLLTMLVQYFIFSTIFKSSIDNFVVYLLTGIILFNFFNESVGLGLTSIIDNAHLINKVYMPKAIYPVSRVLSSFINLAIALVPLLLVVICTGLPVTKAMLLVPIGIICLVVFCIGLAMMLSTMMVFFKDIMFLWNVISTLWMYLTPIFYPVDIIPEAFLPLYKLNPLYQYITFIRTVLMEGIAPSPENYVGCILSAGIMLLIGGLVFKKNQNKFSLYL